MSVVSGLDVVKTDLICYLDAANTKSYPGSGTTWFDLSGNGINGTLINGVSFSANVGGTLVTNVSSQYISVTGINLTDTSYTVMGGTRYTAVSGRIMAALSNNWLLGHHGSLMGRYYAEGWIYQSGTASTAWAIHTGIGDISGDFYSYYINDNLVVSNSSLGSAGPNNFAIGSFQGTSEFANGEISFMVVYDRVLNDDEVKQNFQAFRARLGL